MNRLLISVTNFPRFTDAMKRPPSDPIFALPPQTLLKLKPLRDLCYLQRSIPDMAQYCVAHLFIKAWAKARGLYGAKFGLLSSIHISVLLVPICKLLSQNKGSVSVPDILFTFFNHYAHFDWKQNIVLDPFFHQALKYHRSFREPLCLLGWHPPSLNTALNAPAATLATLTREFERAKSLLSRVGVTWDEFLVSSVAGSAGVDFVGGEADFLQAYKSYIKIDAHYWGGSLEKGRKFLGWLESRCVVLLAGVVPPTSSPFLNDCLHCR